MIASYRRTFLVLGFVGVVLIGAVVALLTNRGAAQPNLEQSGIREYDPPRELSDFTLISDSGAPVSLSDFQGQPVLLFFGYTHCPDVCPLTLLEFKRIRELLGAQADEVAFVFISVDGERDSPQALADYFESRAVADFVTGLTGDEPTLLRIGPDFQLVFKKQAGTADNYLMDHTSSSFLIDAQGDLAAVFAYTAEAQTIADYLRTAVLTT